MVEAAEQALVLTPEQRQRTSLRIDLGGGSLADINWCLKRGYQVITPADKRKSWHTASENG